jgi:hypothetical protein
MNRTYQIKTTRQESCLYLNLLRLGETHYLLCPLVRPLTLT